ncbi:hypothetical protein Pcinc_038580 [Petrolisthes cinctipes]|uniref:Uncharacterized protein n=1 Tax=Petrolisthes cinctipes TaxID=88211 RepID=A0AAE1BQR3_PETCI|nr:hypothetical protein Pcinc_038580 [Petrolisthes cinctipes]
MLFCILPPKFHLSPLNLSETSCPSPTFRVFPYKGTDGLKWFRGGVESGDDWGGVGNNRDDDDCGDEGDVCGMGDGSSGDHSGSYYGCEGDWPGDD